MLTIKQLKEMKPNTIFAKGEAMIRHPWFSPYEYARKEGAYKTVNKEGLTKVKWLAIRGGIHDWAIYHSLDANLEMADCLDGNSHLQVSWERIARGGAKLHHEDEIKQLVPCDDEAFKMYRY